uniref:Protein POLYCHOME n=1 Tax=Leersia perrieri TaxID=77586 RepID=A0A0D9W656_9ORYZ
MPEMRDVKTTALGDLSGGGGFFIRRVASPGSLAARGARKPLAWRFIRPSDNKENAPPIWALKATPGKRRSPLPDWYPRTPLRDITVIVKAIERTRSRIAAAQQQSQTSEQDVAHCSEVQGSLDVAPSCSSTQTAATPASSLVKGSLKIFSSPSETSLVTPSKPMDPALQDHMEKKLSSSIEQIEKMVKRNLKRTPKAAAQPSKRAIQRRTLMSMR